MNLNASNWLTWVAFSIAAVAVLTNMPARAQNVPGMPLTATPLAPTTIIQDTAVPALPPSLEQEARSEIAALRGISNDTFNAYWSRGEILAYMLLRVLEVASETPPYKNPEDQQIANYFNVWVFQENEQIASMALQLYNNFSSNPCGFRLPPGIGTDNGQDYLQEDGVTSFCNTPQPPPILGTFVYTPVPPASQFWSWAQAIVLNQHLNDWGNRLFNPYANYYDPSGNITTSTTSSYGPGPSTQGQAAAIEYFGALESIDEGTAFLVNQYAQIPSMGASPAAQALASTAYLQDLGIDLLDHGLRDLISSDISTASEEVLTLAEAADAAALGVDLAPELSELALQGVDLGVGPIMIAGAITALNLQQIISDSSVPTDLVNTINCALYVGCGNTPATISDYASTIPNGRQMIIEALVRATMPTFSLPRYADPVYGVPPSQGPVLPFDQTFIVNGAAQKTFSYSDWNGNIFTASTVGGWLARQLQSQSATSPVTVPSGLQYVPGIEYQTPNQERWFAWLNEGSFIAQRAAVLVGNGITNACPGGFLAPNGTNVSNQCVQLNTGVQVQAGDQISIGGQVNSVTKVYSQSGLLYIQPTYPFPTSSKLVQVLLLAQPVGELSGQPPTNCMNSSSLYINGSPRTGVSGPDCTQGSISTTASGTVSVVLPPAKFDLTSLTGSLTKYYGDSSFSVASLPFWSSPSNGAVTFTLAAGSAGCSVTSVGMVTIAGLGTCQITASQVATNVFPAEGPITSGFTIVAGQPAMDIIAPAILSGNPATVIVAVYGAGGGTASGSVALSVDGATVGTQTLSGGFAAFTLSKPSLGSHALQANFTGNPSADFLGNLASGTLVVNPNFGTVAAGATPQMRTITYSFTGPTLLSAINILMEGIPGRDYTDYGGDTCRAGTSYTTSQSCTVKVQFSPAAAGPRPGAVTLFAAGATKPLFTTYLNGIGQAAAVTIDPGAENRLNSFPDQQGVAVDGQGNWYIVHGNEVTEPSHNNAVIISGLPSPKAVVVDGAGNLYVSDTVNNNVVMVPNENGKLASADQSVVISGIGTPTGLAVDVSGNLYVADSTTGNVWQVPAGGSAAIPILSGLNAPQGVAVDANLNIYVSTNDNLVTEYPAGYQAGGAIQPVAIGSGYLNPQGLAVDASGTVYVADTGNIRIVKVAPGGASQSVLPFGGPQFGNYPSGPQSITLDSANNLYVIDPSAGLVKISRTQPPSLVFFAVVNTTSPTQTLTVTDAGNQQLNIVGDSLPSNFVTQPSGGTDCMTGTALSPGGQCLFDVAFSPTPGGNLTGNMTMTENGLGSTTQSIPLSGTILQAQTINFTTPPPAQTANDVTGAFNVAATATSGLPITFTSSGVCTNLGTLYLMTGATGTCSVIATQPGNATYGPVSVTVVTTVLLDSRVYFTNLPPVEVLFNTSFTASATGVSGVAITFSASGACSYVSETNSGAVYTATFTMTGATGTCTMTANQAAGNGYVASSASATTVPIQGQTITFTQNAPARATYGQSFTVAATASSGLPVTFTSSGVCTNSGSTFTMSGSSGTCSVIAKQGGNGNYFPATAVTETVKAAPDPIVNFGSVRVGTTSIQTVTYTFTTTATLSAVNVLTAGTPGLDYTLNSASTCAAGNSYNPGNSCTVAVAFKPTAAGARPGAVTLFAQGTNLPLLTEYLSGVGKAAEVTIDPGTKTSLGTMAGGQADGSAIDGAGNVYVADYWDNQVVKIVPSTKAQTAVVTGLTGPVWVALDGAGNLYISQVGSTGVNGSLFKVPNENGTLNSADMATLTYSGLSSPHGLAVDTNGNLYVAEYSSGTISMVPGGAVAGSTLLSGINTPFGVAVDSAKNVYVSSYLGNTVMEYQASCLSQPASCPVPAGSGYNGPQGIAVDAAGNIYVADSGNHRVEFVPNPLPAFPSNTPQSSLAAGLAAPIAVTVTPSGNLLISDNANVFNVNRTTHLPTLTFPGVAIESGASSPSKTVTLTDVGNLELDFTGGSFSPDFPPTSPDFCVNPVEPGGQCSISIVFSPQGGSLGTMTGIWSVTDNAITGGGTQSWNVTGPAWMGQYINFVVSAPASAKQGAKYQFQVEAQACAQFGGCPTQDTITFSSTGVCTHSGTTLVDPVNAIYASTYTMTSGTGSCSVIATAPAIPSSNFAAATATEVVVASQFPQTITFAQPPNQSLSAGPYTLAATASSGLAVTFSSQTTGVCTVSGSTATLLKTGTCTIQAAQPGNNSWSPATPVIRSFQVTP